MPRTLTAALHQEEDWFIAQCLEVDVASQGHTIDEALANLAEAVELCHRHLRVIPADLAAERSLEQAQVDCPLDGL